MFVSLTPAGSLELELVEHRPQCVEVRKQQCVVHTPFDFFGSVWFFEGVQKEFEFRRRLVWNLGRSGLSLAAVSKHC